MSIMWHLILRGKGDIVTIAIRMFQPRYFWQWLSNHGISGAGTEGQSTEVMLNLYN